MDTIYSGEGAKARPLEQHKLRARETWESIAAIWRDGDSVTGKPITEEQRDALRAAAVKGFWLYPLVEAVLGVPR